LIAESVEREITVYHLEMLSPADLRRPSRRRGDLRIKRVDPPCPEVNRFFYLTVGALYHWRERLNWDYNKWRSYVERPEFETYVAFEGALPCGYFTLEQQAGRQIEIKNLGLLPGFTGRGLGGLLVATALETAWAKGPSRVWLHTCSLDHPSALPNYQARGLRLFKVERIRRSFPERSSYEVLSRPAG